MAQSLNIVVQALRAATRYLRGADDKINVQDGHTTDPLIEKAAPKDSVSGSAQDAYQGSTTDKPSVTDTSPESKADPTVRIYEQGVYTVWEHQPSWKDSLPGVDWWQSVVRIYEALPYFGKILRDVYAQGPLLCIISLAMHLTGDVLPTLRLMQASFMLRVMEEAFTSQQLDRRLLFWAIGGKVLITVVAWLMQEIRTAVLPILEKRVNTYFELRLLSIQLRLDLPTSQLPEVKAKMQGYRGLNTSWRSFKRLFDTFGIFLDVSLQAGFIFGRLRHQPGGPTIVLLSLIGPLATIIGRRRFHRVIYAFVTHTPYLRSRTLERLASDFSHKKEVSAYAMGDYVASEYAEAVNATGTKEDDNPGQLHSEPWSLSGLIQRILQELPVMSLAIKGFRSPGTTPLTSIALVEQTSRSIDNTLLTLFNHTRRVVAAFHRLKDLYDIDHIENVIKDGPERYPRAGEDREPTTGGMKVQFKNVSFKYPHSDTTAINNLSFTIPTGGICVIVGENGCGKSSTLNLLIRLYDVTEGEILIDNLPIKEYKLDDLRRSTAIMFQDYHHFDLSLGENIGLGNVERAKDLPAIKEAARLGAAEEIIQKLPKQYDTLMNTRPGTLMVGTIPKGSALESMVKARNEGQKAFSGGEKQRLALSRTFMRSTTCDTRLLAYDEPSAALDPKAEFALFERLRGLRGERTMVFVTHRFGYLTKYADLIIYMDKGRAVEQGSHEELLALDGQYAHLYKVQAQAFA